MPKTLPRKCLNQCTHRSWQNVPWVLDKCHRKNKLCFHQSPEAPCKDSPSNTPLLQSSYSGDFSLCTKACANSPFSGVHRYDGHHSGVSQMSVNHKGPLLITLGFTQLRHTQKEANLLSMKEGCGIIACFKRLYVSTDCFSNTTNLILRQRT